MKVQILWKDHAWEKRINYGEKGLLPCVFITNGGESLEGEIITNKTLPIPSHCSIKLASTAGSRASSKMKTIPFFLSFFTNMYLLCGVSQPVCGGQESVSSTMWDSEIKLRSGLATCTFMH